MIVVHVRRQKLLVSSHWQFGSAEHEANVVYDDEQALVQFPPTVMQAVFSWQAVAELIRAQAGPHEPAPLFQRHWGSRAQLLC